MWKTSLTKHEKVGWNRYFVKKLSTQKQSAYKSVKSYVFVWIKLVKKFLNFSLLTRTRLNCYCVFVFVLQALDIIHNIGVIIKAAQRLISMFRLGLQVGGTSQHGTKKNL